MSCYTGKPERLRQEPATEELEAQLVHYFALPEAIWPTGLKAGIWLAQQAAADDHHQSDDVVADKLLKQMCKASAAYQITQQLSTRRLGLDLTSDCCILMVTII